MPENDILKKRIIELLSDKAYTKDEIKQILWIESDRKLELVLRELRRDNIIYLHEKKYYLEPQKEVRVATPKKKAKKEKHDVSILLLRVMFSFLSIGASIMSVRNTSIWLLESFPPFFAFLLSSIMSIFMIASAGVTVLLWTRKQYFPAILIGLMWAVITATSVSSTVIGMYNANKESFITKQTVERLDTVRDQTLAEYNTQIEDTQRLIDERTITLKRLNDSLVGMDTTSKEYKTISDKIFQAENFIRVRVEEKKALVDKRIALLESADDVEVVAKTFAEEMEGLFHIPASLINFILTCFVAILVDGIAPLSASMALFLKEDAHDHTVSN